MRRLNRWITADTSDLTYEIFASSLWLAQLVVLLGLSRLILRNELSLLLLKLTLRELYIGLNLRGGETSTEAIVEVESCFWGD